MSSATTPHRFFARFSQLPELLAVVTAACNRAGLSANARQRAELVLEESFANSIHHGYGGESDRPVWLAAAMLPDGLQVVYQDEAPPFDPLAPIPPRMHGQVGGVGRMMIQSLPRHAEYAHVDGRNVLSFDFARRDRLTETEAEPQSV